LVLSLKLVHLRLLSLCLVWPHSPALFRIRTGAVTHPGISFFCNPSGQALRSVAGLALFNTEGRTFNFLRPGF